jgi:16S rRNA (guanine966-N2)-methyltransferase
MRVIAGEFRSRRLQSIPGLDTRPTPDRMRETLFSILMPRIEDTVFVDAYAGTGAVGIEALSRGARHAYFLERAKPALEVLRANLASLGLQDRATVVPGRVHLTLDRYPGAIVFLDPPYELEKEYNTALEVLAQHPPPLTIVQHSAHFKLEDAYGPLRRTRTVKQGENVLSFFVPE